MFDLIPNCALAWCARPAGPARLARCDTLALRIVRTRAPLGRHAHCLVTAARGILIIVQMSRPHAV